VRRKIQLEERERERERRGGGDQVIETQSEKEGDRDLSHRDTKGERRRQGVKKTQLKEREI